MEPTFKLALKTNLFQFLWLKSLTGFDQRHHCEKCLKGEMSSAIPFVPSRYPAGFTAEGRIDGPGPFAYLCGVSHFARFYDQHLHVLMAPDPASAFTHEDNNVCLLVTGMRRLPIPALPPEATCLPEEYRTCRNFQAGWHLFPNDQKPFAEVPAAKS